MAKKDTTATPPSLPLSGDERISVAYHSGPTEIGFCGNHWSRGVAQTVTPAEWHAMQLRADFEHYNFTEEK